MEYYVRSLSQPSDRIGVHTETVRSQITIHIFVVVHLAALSSLSDGSLLPAFCQPSNRCGSQLPVTLRESAPFRVIMGVSSLSRHHGSRLPTLCVSEVCFSLPPFSAGISSLFHRGSRVINPLITAGVSSLSLGVSSLRVITGVSSLLFAGVSSLSHHHVGVSSLLR